jgi:putative methanogenesis marker protein 12
MFVGIDHGTTAIRFGTDDGHVFEMPRESATEMAHEVLLGHILNGLCINADDIDLIAVGYSMGDGISKITGMRYVTNRGVRRTKGAGTFIGGGTQVFDAIKTSNIPAIVLPGIHSMSNIDPRMKMFSHGASPDKLGVSYHAHLGGYDTFILSDVTSNAVTVGVADARIIGAIDACIFAPGALQGPLDLEAIRNIDDGKMSANEAFSRGGVLKRTNFKSLEELLMSKDEEAQLALDRLALFAAMEVAGMQVLVEEYSSSESIFICGPVEIEERMASLLGVKTTHLDKWSAAIGCAEIARDVYAGKENILGVEVDYERE